MKTVGEQLLAYLQTNGLNTTKMAAIVNRYPGGDRVRRQHLDNLLKGTVGNPRFLHPLAAAMGSTMEQLLTGAYVPEDLGTTSQSKDLSDVKNITPPVAKNQQAKTGEDAEFLPSPEIPTDMKFSHPRLHSAVLLLGNLLGALDKDSRDVIAGLLGKVARDPDKAETLALRIVRNATLQDRLVSDDDLNRRLTQPGAVETTPSPL